VSRILLPAVLAGLLVLSGGATTAQDAKKEVKKDDPAPKAKGFLPMNWGKLGLTDAQKQDVYTVQGKYNAEIDKLDAKIRELKAARDKEMKAVLTPDQKKRLEEILLGKDR
jgi:Spy/CpxP family protein refolding chaperone